MNPLQSSPRALLASGLLWAAFFAACLFYGIGENLFLLSLSSGFTLLALMLAAPRYLLMRLKAREPGVWLALGVIVILIFSHLFVSISPDSSFAASWLFACMPLWYLAYSSLDDRRLLRWLLVVTVGLFALLSAVRFLAFGERAHAPLIDPNNYASLLYLLWIPLTGIFLKRAWTEPDRTSLLNLAVLFIPVSFLLTLSVFATTSRAGGVITVAALGGWLLLALLRRYPLRPWLLLAASVAVSYFVCLLRAPSLASGSVDAVEISAGVSVRGALTEAGLRMLMEAPFGTGLFTFALRYPLFRQQGDQSTAGMFVHNDYLQLLIETGPWLVAILLLIGLVIGLKLLRILRNRQSGGVVDFGIGMALLALLAHATINFVFYILPLGIGFAVLCAELFSPTKRVGVSVRALDSGTGTGTGTGTEEADAPLRWFAGIAGWAAVLAVALASWGYLVLETVTQGVFGGQPVPFLARELRRNPDAMLSYARFAQSMDATSSVPILGEALVRTALSQQQPADIDEKRQQLHLYRRAMALDPFNPMVYESFYQFLRSNMDRTLAAELRPEEAPVLLLQQAVRLDVRRVDNVLELLRIYDQLGSSDQALEFLKISVFPWLERLRWRDPAAADELIAEMRRRAESAGDSTFLEELAERETAVRRIASQPQRRGWFQN